MLDREIWINSIIEGLYASNSFAARSIDMSSCVTGKTVHVPNAGADPSVEKNRKKFPATIESREDIDLSFDINEYTTAPIRVSSAEETVLVYPKRESIVRASRNKLINDVHGDLIYEWMPSGIKTVDTSGNSVAAHIAGATSNRKLLTKDDILKVAPVFDQDDIPDAGRCMLLDAVMYNQLLKSLTESEAMGFIASANAQTGVIGSLYGFDFYKRSRVAKCKNDGTVKRWEASNTATDGAAALAWHVDSVCRALGDIEEFSKEKDPTYYADILSFLVRAGGHHLRNDKKGLVLLYQATA